MEKNNNLLSIHYNTGIEAIRSWRALNKNMHADFKQSQNVNSFMMWDHKCQCPFMELVSSLYFHVFLVLTLQIITKSFKCKITISSTNTFSKCMFHLNGKLLFNLELLTMHSLAIDRYTCTSLLENPTSYVWGPFSVLFICELHDPNTDTNNCNISHYQHILYKIPFNDQLTSWLTKFWLTGREYFHWSAKGNNQRACHMLKFEQHAHIYINIHISHFFSHPKSAHTVKNFHTL